MFKGILKDLVLGNSYYWMTQADWTLLCDIFQDEEDIMSILNAFETTTENGETIYYINEDALDFDTWGTFADEGVELGTFNYIKSTDTFLPKV